MNSSDRRMRSFTAHRLAATLTELGGAPRPDYLDHIVARAGQTRQRPAWTFAERWLPMSIAMRSGYAPRAAFLFLLALVLVGLIAGAVLVTGALPRQPGPLGTSNGLVAFQSGNNIVAVQPDGSERSVLVRDASDREGMAFSPDGRRLAYWSRNLDLWDLVVVDADGSHRLVIDAGRYVPTGVRPDWSPDGSRIAYSARTVARPRPQSCAGWGAQNGDFCSSRIFVAAADGSGADQLGDPALDARSPAWSPDGSTIAFGAGNANAAIGVRLYLMNADGSNVRQLSDVRGTDWAFVSIDWSHDGSRIVAQASATDDLGEWDIWEINADGSGATDVGAHVGGDEVIPSWAPDRDALAWCWNGVVLLDEGSEPLDLPSLGCAPVWSPDGKLLLARGRDDGTLVVTDLQGVVQLTIDGVTGSAGAWQPVASNG